MQRHRQDADTEVELLSTRICIEDSSTLVMVTFKNCLGPGRVAVRPLGMGRRVLINMESLTRMRIMAAGSGSHCQGQ
ncbi:hypothetical protein BgiBS90_004930 [Biomphalaria glabrata]|nr:hypothetical protein BgiBS90_004930 [Biomphalaria glabrata]